jgi:predicted MFS family arabinose efflux permease
VFACAAMSLTLWAFTVALAIAAYKAGGEGAVTLAVVARVVPGALAGPFTAPLVERHSPRTVLVSLTGAATAALAALTLLAALHGPFALVLLLAAAFSAPASGQEPAQAALLPGLARSPRQLAVADGLRQGCGNAASCVGALAAGAAAASLSVSAAFALALLASGGAVLALALLAADPRPARRPARADASVAAELQLGLREVRAAPELRESAGLLAAVGLIYGVLDVLMVVVAVKLVGLGTAGVGILKAAWGAGGLVGGFAALTLLARGRFSTALDAGAALIAVPLTIIALAADPLVAVGGLLVLGLGHAVAETAGRTFVQRLASDESLARALAVAETGSRLTVALGSILAPLLIALLGIRGALLATALVLPAVVMARWRAMQDLDAQAAVPERQLQALRALDIFAPVPLATVETLAIRSRPRVVVASEQILAPGDIGSRLYVIADGGVEVQAGSVVRRLGPGDYFGEIALLRDVKRAAGVVATSDGLLYVLGRADFLQGVTGRVHATQAARRLPEARPRASTQPPV